MAVDSKLRPIISKLSKEDNWPHLERWCAFWADMLCKIWHKQHRDDCLRGHNIRMWHHRTHGWSLSSGCTHIQTGQKGSEFKSQVILCNVQCTKGHSSTLAWPSISRWWFSLTVTVISHKYWGQITSSLWRTRQLYRTFLFNYECNQNYYGPSVKSISLSYLSLSKLALGLQNVFGTDFVWKALWVKVNTTHTHTHQTHKGPIIENRIGLATMLFSSTVLMLGEFCTSTNKRQKPEKALAEY